MGTTAVFEREREHSYIQMLLMWWEDEGNVGRPYGKGGKGRGEGRGMRHLGENRGREAQGKGMRDLGENRGREARVRARLREWARKRHMARGRKLFWGVEASAEGSGRSVHALAARLCVYAELMQVKA